MKERVQEQGLRERERERERQKQAPLLSREPDAGLKPKTLGS